MVLAENPKHNATARRVAKNVLGHVVPQVD